MKCIFCLHKSTSVVNSRKSHNGLFVWRRRSCERCSAVFTTKESPLGDNLFVIKRNGHRQRFMYEKLFVSIVYAIERGKDNDRGDQATFAKALAEKTISLLLKEKKRDIPTADIVRLCYRLLYREDAFFAERYMHYSAYREKICSPLRIELSRRF